MHKNNIKKLFNALNDSNVDYVVPRKYSHLPERSGDDIDLFIRESSFDKGIEVCEELGFSRSANRNRLSINTALQKSYQDPKKVYKFIKNSPFEALSTITIGKKSGDSSNKAKGHRNVKLEKKNVRLDIRNNIAYRSPQNGKRYPVQKRVNELMFEQTQMHRGIVIPTPPNELGHIIPHCVFDKEGEFSDYYRNRCVELSKIVLDNEEYNATFKHILSLIFYDASELVYNLIKSKEYGSLRTKLRQFDQY